jgi:hypothetical protein
MDMEFDIQYQENDNFPDSNFLFCRYVITLFSAHEVSYYVSILG